MDFEGADPAPVAIVVMHESPVTRLAEDDRTGTKSAALVTVLQLDQLNRLTMERRSQNKHTIAERCLLLWIAIIERLGP